MCLHVVLLHTFCSIPRAVVAETFATLFCAEDGNSYSTPGVVPLSARDEIAIHDACQRAHSVHCNAKLLVPPLQEMQDAFIDRTFYRSQRRCGGAYERLPQRFCYQSTPGLHNHFDQYATSHAFLHTALQNCPICVNTCDADVIFAASLILHWQAAVGLLEGWHFLSLPKVLSARYWSMLKSHIGGMAGEPLIVIVEDYALDTPFYVHHLQALKSAGWTLENRVILGVTMSNMITSFAREAMLSTSWRDNAQDELERRARFDKHLVCNSSFGGPLMVTVPRWVGISSGVNWIEGEAAAHTRRILALYDVGLKFSTNGTKVEHTGTWHADRDDSKQWARPIIRQTIIRKGFTCCATGCFLPVDASKFSPSCSHFDALSVYEKASSSVFCIEPPGDVLGRSHFYVAVHCGCVPVLIDGGHTGYPFDARVAWAWRAPDRPSRADIHASFLDYTRFTLPVRASTLASGTWVDLMVRLASETDDKRLHEMQKALVDAAQWFSHPRSRSVCPSDTARRYDRVLRHAYQSACDAYTAFTNVVLHAMEVMGSCAP